MPDHPLEMQSIPSQGVGQNQFDRFFETTPSPMIAAGFDGYMKRVNRATEQLAGFTAEELKAQPFSHFIHPDDRETAELAILEIAASGNGQAIDIRILYQDGSYRWTQWTGTPFLEQGIFYLVGKDVTEQHLARQALEKRVQADRDLENFFNNAPDGMFVGGYDGYIKRSNAALHALTGFTAEQLMAEPIIAFAHPDEREQVAAEVQRIIAGEITHGFELRVRCADGAYKRVVWNASNFAELGVFYAIGTDVTARRAAEASLAERAKQQEAVAELGRLALAAADLPQLMRGAAELAARTLAVEFAEIRELSPDRRQTMLKAGFGWREGSLSQAPIGVEPETVSGYMLSTGQPVVIEDLPSETRFHGSDVLREHGVTSGVGCVIHGPERPYGVLAAYSNRPRKFSEDDVRFLQAAASVLSAAINRQQAVDDFNRFFDSSPDLMIIAGFDGRVRRMNSPTGSENYLSPADVRDQPLLNFIHPDDKETAARELEKLLITGTTKPFEVRSLMKDGSYNWFSWSATAFPDRQIMYAVGQNTTARRRAEEELQRFFDNSPDVLVVCGFDGEFKRYNPACLAFSGFSPQELAAMPSFLDTVHPDDRAMGTAEIMKLREGGKLSGLEIRGLTKDGSYHWVSWNVTAFPDWQEFYITGHIVTERHIAEEALRQRARQQEAVAQLGSRSLATPDLAAIMADACLVLAQTLDMEYSEILELQPGEDEFVLTAGFGWREDQIGSARVSARPENAGGYILATKKPLVVSDWAQEDCVRAAPLLKEHQAVSGMGCLITAAERPYGVLGVHSSRRRTFSENDVHFLEAVANILAAAIERKRSEGQIERFFDRTPSPMVIVGFDGAFKYATPAAIDFTGCTRDELFARPFFSIFHPEDVESTQNLFPELLAGKSLHGTERRIRFKDGTYRWFANDMQADAERQLLYVIAYDVTDRHAAEASLAERARQQEAVAESGRLALTNRDLTDLFQEVATRLAQTLGVEYSEILELQPDGREFVLKAGVGWQEEQLGQTRISSGAETVSGYLLATGAPVVIEDLKHETRFQGAPPLHEQGMISGMACLIPGVERPYGVLGAHSPHSRRFSDNDIHFLEAVANILAAAIARKRSEQERERFFDRTLAPMLIVGFDGIVKYANPAATTVSGYSREELLSTPYLSFVHPDDAERTAATLPEMMADKSFHDFEVRIRCKDGSHRWFAFDSSPDPERQAFYAIVHDVTDRHLAEEALAARARQQEAIAALGGRALAGGELSALLNDAAAVLARTLDMEFAEVFELQPGGQELILTAGYGWREEQFGQVRASTDDDDKSVRLLSSMKPVIMDELHPESSLPSVHQFAEQGSASGMACLIQQSGRPWGILGVRSTRQRVFSENDLHFVEAVGNILSSAIERRRAEEELNRFIEPSLNPMFVGGFDGKVKRCNQALEILSGYSSAELMSRAMWRLVHHDDRRAMLAAARELAAGREAKALEFRMACKDGSYKWTVWNCTSFPDWQVFYATGYDVSDLHAATDALHQRARQQQAVAELGARALSGADLQSLFDETVAAVSRTLQVEFATLLELQSDGREFVLKAGYGWRPELIGKVRIPANSQFLGGYALASDKPVFVENVWTESRFQPHPLVAAHSIISEMGCAVPGRPRPRGVLCVHSTRSRTFQEDDALFLQAAANTLAAAIDRRRAEEELKRFVEPSLNPMFVGSFDGTLKDCNHATELLTGYTRDEMRGRPIAAFVHPDDRQTVAAEFVKVATGESAESFSVRIVAKNGSTKWTIWNATSFPEWEEMYATGQDVTEQHLAEEELRASEEMLVATDNSALDGIVLLDADGNVVHWNAAAEKIFGYRAEEIRGRNLHHTLVPPEMREKFEQGWPHFQQTGAGPVIGKVLELEALRKNGSRFPVEVSVAAVSLHGRWNAVGVIRDITTRKQQEAELIAAKKAAEAANRAKSDFLANMSHEIRTPMNGVIGLTSLVLDTDLNAEQRQYLDGVMLSAEALLKIINDILDFSKIEAGRLELEHIDFDLREAVGNTMQTLALRAHQKNLELTYNVRPEAPDALVGDPARLWQVIVNLVGNAVKFTDQGEVSLSVAVETLQEHAVCLHFTVSDTGVGIPADKQQMLFKPFSQVDTSMARKYGGTGLGLAISAQIVDMMKGRIWFESELGKGSKFHFTAWFDRRTTPLAKRAPLPPSTLDNLRVLVVDDNATNRTILRDMLTHWGMRPDEAERGEAALESLQAAFQAGDPFGLILLDVMMPGMDGFEVLERIRQMPEIDRPVIMMLSSRDEPGDAARARELGAAAYIIKPIRPSDLLDAIMKALDVTFEAGAAKPAAAPAQAAPRGPGLRILVAEDNPINQMLAVRMLEKAGHSVARANNGQEVLAAIGGESFDLVLMDVQMPVMDGFEATALIRQQEKQTGGHLPIVAMTAHAMKGDRERCLEAGMDDYVAKPVQRDELFGAIAAATTNKTPAAAPGGSS